jgi:alkylation response protein AidB-like acyl-CoA dehydrogenase
MDFAYSEEQETFRELLQRFVREELPTSELRRLSLTADGLDRTLWKKLAEELGLQGLPIPEQYGGQGFGFLELGIVFEELGRALLCSPLFATTCLATRAIQHAGSEEQKQRLLEPIAGGDCIATLALLEAGGSWDPADVALIAEPDGDQFVLSGEKRFVVDGQNADLLVVAARLPGTRGEDGLTLVALHSDAGEVEVQPFEPLDLSRKQAHLSLNGARGESLGPAGGARAALRRTLDEAAIALAAESAGGASACLDAAVAYAGSRVQFARPIGSFQAIKHKCAEVLLEVESAKASARWASWVVEQDGADLTEAASLAKATCTDAYLRAAQENVQIHGGIGFTFEGDPHLYYRRARSSEAMLGDSSYHRARMLQAHGI